MKIKYSDKRLEEIHLARVIHSDPRYHGFRSFFPYKMEAECALELARQKRLADDSAIYSENEEESGK